MRHSVNQKKGLSACEKGIRGMTQDSNTQFIKQKHTTHSIFQG